MAKAYWIAFYKSIKDQEKFAGYANQEVLRELSDGVERDLRVVEGIAP